MCDPWYENLWYGPFLCIFFLETWRRNLTTNADLRAPPLKNDRGFYSSSSLIPYFVAFMKYLQAWGLSPVTDDGMTIESLATYQQILQEPLISDQ